MAKTKKLIKKKFFDVEIPIIKKELEVYSGTLEELNGKYIKFDLSSILRGKALELSLKITADEKTASANPKKITLQEFYIRRLMRKRTDYAEDSFLAPCSDHRIRIKYLITTKKPVSRAVLTSLKKSAKEFLGNYIKEKEFESLVKDVINNQIQKDLNGKLRKLYPLNICEIKHLGIEDLKEHELYELERAKKTEVAEESKSKEKENVSS
ncbi:MAG: hypothetical protein WC533_04560 [Candidatus Pacearchaeota archaeon]